MQTRWPTHPRIILAFRFYTGPQLPITNANILRMKKENISWKFCNRTWFAKGIFPAMGVEKFCPSYDSHSVFLNMSETWWHLLRRETWNLIDVFPKFILSNSWFLTDCFVQGSNKNTAAPSVCDLQELYFKLHISATYDRWTYFFFNDSAQCFCHTADQRYLLQKE